MKLIIDEKVCLKHHLTLQEFLLTLAIKDTSNLIPILDNLVSREILLYKDGKYQVSPNWNDELDTILLDSSGGIYNEERLTNLAKQMRELFPQGKVPGTAYYYRCNVREVVLKLKKFFEIYGNFSDDRILDATRRFLASFQGNYYYLPLIKYFIHKDKLKMGEDGLQHVSPESPLASYLENKEDTSAVSASDDWLMTVRN